MLLYRRYLIYFEPEMFWSQITFCPHRTVESERNILTNPTDDKSPNKFDYKFSKFPMDQMNFLLVVSERVAKRKIFWMSRGAVESLMEMIALL